MSQAYRDRLEAAVDSMGISISIAVYGVPVVALFFVLWQFRLAREAERRWGDLGLGAGWAIGGWLVPGDGFVVAPVQLARVAALLVGRLRAPAWGGVQLVLGWASTFALGCVLLGGRDLAQPQQLARVGVRGETWGTRTEEALLGQRLSALACALLIASARLGLAMVRSRSGRTMARRSLCSQLHTVSYEPRPSTRCRPSAETPVFWDVTNHTAANQSVNGNRDR